jgi:hypothetical protein
MDIQEMLSSYCCNRSFKAFADNKGILASIAEKSCRNFDMKSQNQNGAQQRIHHFAVGHTLSQLGPEVLNRKHFFNLKLDYFTRTREAHMHSLLLPDSFPSWKELQKDIYYIRDVSSHYAHEFTHLGNYFSFNCVPLFLVESFELATLQVYLETKKITYQQYLSNSNIEGDLIDFLCDRFFPLQRSRQPLNDESLRLQEEYKQMRSYYRKRMTLDTAISHLLFVEVKEDFEWVINGEHRLFKVGKGKYLSFYGCLFLLSMFLYKSEAKQLISKVNGFKQNDDDEFRSKRSIFTFFSKRLSGQDTDGAEANLMKFRDLVHYLNRYPTCWNGELELEAKNPQMVELLREAIIRMELKRSYPVNGGNERFVEYAKCQLWGDSQQKGEWDSEAFSYEMNSHPALVGERIKLQNLQQVGIVDERRHREMDKVRRSIAELERENRSNPATVRLKERISRNTLIASYGRIQDRFMEMAARYLAEECYFGADAKFRMYKFYSTEDQNEELATLKTELPKKEYDKLKFHQGRLVHFDTFDSHKLRYSEWDTPFVVADNAIQVQLVDADGSSPFTLTVQRVLMVYLLDHALFGDKAEGAGKALLCDYYRAQRAEQTMGIDVLNQSEAISPEEKTRLKKILPKRLLHHYSPPVQSCIGEQSALALVLKDADDREKRYQALKDRAEMEGALEDFCNRNKGKQHKLQFVRKAWNLMYFKEVYQQQVEASGEHHKRYHITKDEFNGFCRYMYAFDEVPEYKGYLRDLLVGKGFLENEELRVLFERSESLGDLFEETRRCYVSWLEKNDAPAAREDKYHLEGYESMLSGEMFYINLSHFIAYLDAKGMLRRGPNGEIRHRALANVRYLQPTYYYKDALTPEEYRTCGKLFNRLRHAKLEDALLYEMSLHYLHTDLTIRQMERVDVAEMLLQDVVFDIVDVAGCALYQLVIPFKKIDSYVELVSLKKAQEDEPGASFLSNIVGYIRKMSGSRELKEVAQHLSVGVLTFDELNTVDRHIVTSTLGFISLNMMLEEYFVLKDGLTTEGQSRILFDQLKGLKPYYSRDTRSRAFHLGMPDKGYDEICRAVENTFIVNEVLPVSATCYEELPLPTKKVCDALLKCNHGNFYNPRERDGKKKVADALQRFFAEVIGVRRGAPAKARSISLRR